MRQFTCKINHILQVISDHLIYSPFWPSPGQDLESEISKSNILQFIDYIDILLLLLIMKKYVVNFPRECLFIYARVSGYSQHSYFSHIDVFSFGIVGIILTVETKWMTTEAFFSLSQVNLSKFYQPASKLPLCKLSLKQENSVLMWPNSWLQYPELFTKLLH